MSKQENISKNIKRKVALLSSYQRENILKLKECAIENSSYVFYLTRIGQGYAGLCESNIRPMVEKADLPENVQPWWEWEKQSFILYPHFLNRKRDKND
jgi:hypothetical protein